MKGSRHAALRSLLQENSLSKQSEVAHAMEQLGFEVTQSSISRDFQDLGVVKHGGRYVVMEPEGGSALRQPLIREISTAGPNLIVIKTEAGAANVVAAAIDRLGTDDIVGTVAGDDTLFLATTDSESQVRALGRVQRLM